MMKLPFQCTISKVRFRCIVLWNPKHIWRLLCHKISTVNFAKDLLQFQLKTSERINGSSPGTFLKMSFREIHAKYREDHQNCVKCGVFVQYSVFCKFSLNEISADFRVMRLNISASHPFADNFFTRYWMKAVVFCTKSWGVISVNLSINFTRMMLRWRCFPVCLLHDSPNFQRDFRWVTSSV